MHSMFDLSIIPILMPILAVIFTLVIVVVLIVVNGKTKQTQSYAVNQKAFEELARELRADHAAMQAELAAMKESMHSIKKMMEDVQ